MGKQFDKWEVIKSLDEGGQAWVYLVKERDDSSDNRYVLKRLKNTNRLDRFKAEIESLQKLEHPGIVKLVGFKIDNEHPWFVQEYYSGGNLEQYIRNKGALDCDKALSLLIDIATALDYAHSFGNIHRDIKPANIFLQQEEGQAVLGDFGLVWEDKQGERVTMTDEALGSFRYRAPELADGRVNQPTRQCDIYSLGKVLYFMLSGGRVFEREIHRNREWDLRELHQDVQFEHINNLLDHMITFNPNDRYSASEVRIKSQEIKRLIDGGFAPLEGKTVSRCKYCGIGYYQPIVDSDESFMHFFGFSPSSIQGGGRGWRVLVCNECGHLEFFRMDGAPNKWWPENKSR